MHKPSLTTPTVFCKAYPHHRQVPPQCMLGMVSADVNYFANHCAQLTRLDIIFPILNAWADCKQHVQRVLDNLPLSLTHLSLQVSAITLSLEKLPPKLTHLKIFNFAYKNSASVSLDHLPQSLKHLYFSGNNSVSNLPPNLVSLHLDGHEFNHPLDRLPFSLKKLVVNPHLLDKVPSHLTTVVMIKL